MVEKTADHTQRSLGCFTTRYTLTASDIVISMFNPEFKSLIMNSESLRGTHLLKSIYQLQSCMVYPQTGQDQTLRGLYEITVRLIAPQLCSQRRCAPKWI